MLYYDEKEEQVRAEQLSLILGHDYLISFQERQGDVFNGVRERIRKSKGRIRKAGADYLAYALIDAVVDNYFIILEHFGEKIESLEEDLIAAVAMDGYYQEPLPSVEDDQYGLLQFSSDRVCVTPHVAYQTDDSVVRQADMFIRSVLAVLEGREEIPYLINLDYKDYAPLNRLTRAPWRRKDG